MLESSGAVPVVIKSLVFPASAADTMRCERPNVASFTISSSATDRAVFLVGTLCDLAHIVWRRRPGRYMDINGGVHVRRFYPAGPDGCHPRRLGAAAGDIRRSADGPHRRRRSRSHADPLSAPPYAGASVRHAAGAKSGGRRGHHQRGVPGRVAAGWELRGTLGGVDLAVGDRPLQGAVDPAPQARGGARRRGRDRSGGSERQSRDRDREEGSQARSCASASPSCRASIARSSISSTTTRNPSRRSRASWAFPKRR